MVALILIYELKGKAKTCPEIFRLVLGGPCAQCCPCEASEQKWGQKPQSQGDKALNASSFDLSGINIKQANKK